MTPEAVAVVQGFLDRAAARDFVGVSDSLDPDVVAFGTRGGLDEARVLRGPAAVIDYLREVQDTWRRFEVEAEPLIEVGDTIVVFLHETAQARHGDLEAQLDTAMTFKVRGRKIVEMTGYLDRQEALQAAGFSEPAL
jgi:ketosteroid isomerase-like protein